MKNGFSVPQLILYEKIKAAVLDRNKKQLVYFLGKFK